MRLATCFNCGLSYVPEYSGYHTCPPRPQLLKMPGDWFIDTLWVEQIRQLKKNNKRNKRMRRHK